MATDGFQQERRSGHPHPVVCLPFLSWLDRMIVAPATVCAFVLLTGLAGVSLAQDVLVLTEIPRNADPGRAACSMDALYPAGTRVVVSKRPFAADHVLVLSEGLHSAGSPIVSYDGRRVFFAGKQNPGAEWQVYEAPITGGRPRPTTAVKGGATHPALLPDGSIVFSSPATAAVESSAAPRPQLFVQPRGGKPLQLTFTPSGATDPTMLLDGRILFVSGQPAQMQHAGFTPLAGEALYTINNDGTELTAFACQHDRPALLQDPRQLNDRRVAFLVRDNTGFRFRAETVQTARPFASRAELFCAAGDPQDTTTPALSVRSVRPCGESNLLVCASVPGKGIGWACYRLSCGSSTPLLQIFADPAKDTVEAVEAAASVTPMGRLSTMDTAKHSGQILCLDVNDTSLATASGHPAKAVRVRLLAGGSGPSNQKPGNLIAVSNTGLPRILGEVEVQADGSFMAEVPADVPIGFEALDEHGEVLRREAPNLWVRSGENRACVGCHAAHNRAPHNHRPMAVRVPVPSFCSSPQTKLASQASR